MYGRENLHRFVARIHTLKLLVDLQNATQLTVKLAPFDMRQIEIDALAVFFNTQPFIHANVKDFTSRNIARD